MVVLLFAFLLLTPVLAAPTKVPITNVDAQSMPTSEGGGAECAGCTIVVSLIEQLSVIHNKSVDRVVDELCDLFPSDFSSICTYYVNLYGADVIQMLENDANADDVCQGIMLCTKPTCKLWPASEYSLQNRAHRKPVSATKRDSPWQWIVDLINRLAQNHEPIVDLDHDLYSSIPTLRGSNWRGKDCDELIGSIYPGRYQSDFDASVDHNCNGIYGTDNNGNSYEETLCGNSGPMGVVVLGDSAGAHFSIPPAYMTAKLINENTFSNLLDVLENEIDWPQLGGYTGFMPSSTYTPVQSIYQYMNQRNRCNHRDYQNLGVNGARSGSMADNVILSLARNNKTDNPALVFFELVGNDVCNGHHTLSTMTTPAEFEANVLQSLHFLDDHLPQGSHVVFIGLADGRILYDSLHNRTHPLGVTYSAVYDFLNCLHISPCWVWMNTNETIRNAGSARAAELSAIYPKIMSQYKFRNFDMAYYDFPTLFNTVIKMWQKKGGETWELIEPVDGFHPNQIANYLMAQVLWGNLLTDHPSFVGAVNPNNNKIQSLFGNQGGY